MAHIQPSFPGGNPYPDLSSEPIIYGFELVVTGSTTFTLTPGLARAFTSSDIISYPGNEAGFSGLITIDISKVGALGCYPNSLSVLTDSTSLSVYILGDSTGKNSPTFVVATGNLFLLPGYNIWRKIGTVYVNSSINSLYEFTQTGTGIERQYILIEPFPGNNFTTGNFHPFTVNTGGFPCNPNFAEEALFARAIIPASVTDYVSITSFDHFGPLNLKPPFTLISPVAGNELRDQVWVPLTNIGDNIGVYMTVAGAGNVMATAFLGWTENMGLKAI